MFINNYQRNVGPTTDPQVLVGFVELDNRKARIGPRMELFREGCGLDFPERTPKFIPIGKERIALHDPQSKFWSKRDFWNQGSLDFEQETWRLSQDFSLKLAKFLACYTISMSMTVH